MPCTFSRKNKALPCGGGAVLGCDVHLEHLASLVPPSARLCWKPKPTFIMHGLPQLFFKRGMKPRLEHTPYGEWVLCLWHHWPGRSVKTATIRVLKAIWCLWAENAKKNLLHRTNPASHCPKEGQPRTKTVWDSARRPENTFRTLLRCLGAS